MIELVRTCAELADDVGVAFGEADRVPLRRDDYALAAGPDPGRNLASAIATGADSVNWSAVPAGIFDAAERTVGVARRGADGVDESRCARRIVGSGAGFGDRGAAAVGRLGGSGVLDADGVAVFPLVDRRQTSPSPNRLRGIMIGGPPR